MCVYGILPVSKLWKLVAMFLLLDLENFKTNLISSRGGKDVVLVVVVRGKDKTSEAF